MPISKPILFICPKCGYELTKMVGDVITPGDLEPRCPKCNTPMKMASIEEGLFGMLKGLIFGKLKGS